MTGIYCITNLINNKCYIGQSKDIERRWRNERSRANQPSSVEYDKLLCRAFRKYGIENFSWEILEECDVELLNEREEYWANYYNSYIPYGYNVARCGSQNAIIVPEEIALIRQLLIEGYTNHEIAEMTGRSWRTVSDINCGRAWKNSQIDYPIRRSLHGDRVRLMAGMTNETAATNEPDYLVGDCTREDFLALYDHAVQNNLNAVWMSEQIGVTDTQIRRVIKKIGLPTFTEAKRKQREAAKRVVPKVRQYDLDGNFLNEFPSASRAAEACGSTKKSASHILDCCRGYRQTAFGYNWKFVDNNE